MSDWSPQRGTLHTDPRISRDPKQDKNKETITKYIKFLKNLKSIHREEEGDMLPRNNIEYNSFLFIRTKQMQSWTEWPSIFKERKGRKSLLGILHPFKISIIWRQYWNTFREKKSKKNHQQIYSADNQCCKNSSGWRKMNSDVK